LPRRKGRAAASRPVARALTLPRSNPASGAAAAIPDAPVVTPEVAATDSRKVLNSIAPAKSLDGADPAVQVRVEPVTGARRNIPLIGRLSRRADYVPPSALRDPGLPNLPHRQISRNVNINVKVHVNAAGKVDYSEVISKVAEADRDLASLAMFAGRRWEFAPARTAGSAVAGEVILHYQFRATPGANASQAVAARWRVDLQSRQFLQILVVESYDLYEWYIKMTRLNVSRAREEFPELVNRAAYGKERTIVSRRGKDLAAVIPIEDLRLLERLAREEMDRLDIESARAALAESGKNIPLRDFLHETGD
jgi:prevent-host-death family protein